MNLDPKSDVLGDDWASAIKVFKERSRQELELTSIQPGDRVLVKTRNTHYLFAWENTDLALLTSNSPRAPSGQVRIMGCSFGLSSSIRPDALFCGGNLEFTHSEGEKRWTTSEIAEIHLLHQSTPTRPSTL